MHSRALAAILSICAAIQPVFAADFAPKRIVAMSRAVPPHDLLQSTPAGSVAPPALIPGVVQAASPDVSVALAAMEEESGPAPEGAAPAHRIPVKRVVHLMLENASFDRVFGLLQAQLPELDGLTGDDGLPLDPSDHSRGVVPITRAEHFGGLNPNHSHRSILRQMYGRHDARTSSTPPMNGFAWDHWMSHGQWEAARQSAAVFAPEQLPVLSELARHFRIFDRWFSSLPGPTWPNRAFALAGTSNGQITMAGRTRDWLIQQAARVFVGGAYAVASIFDRLTGAGVSWRIYHHGFVTAYQFPHVRDNPKNVSPFETFKKDAADGTLPAFVSIEPRYYNDLFHKANDFHAPHDAREAERLIADIYNILRADQKLFVETLFVITFDEHGGFYDHVPPPVAVSPDDKRARDSTFDFKRLGVRVPALFISPWVAAGSVDHNVYDHTSILKILEEMFGLEPLTRRDAAARSPADGFLAAPRQDTPERIEPPAPGSERSTDPRLSAEDPNGALAHLMSAAMKGVELYYHCRARIRRAILGP